MCTLKWHAESSKLCQTKKEYHGLVLCDTKYDKNDSFVSITS